MIKASTVLVLPSILEDGRFLSLVGPTLEEAKQYAQFFEDRILATRRNVRVIDKDELLFTEYHGQIHTEDQRVDDGSLQEYFDEVGKLRRCEVRGTRGARALYLDITNNVVAVGTMVVYNPNHATKGFVDGSVASTLARLKSRYSDQALAA